MIRRPRGRPRHDDVLTQAEWRPVGRLRHGMPVRVIARRQGISIDAVKFHVKNAVGKLGLSGQQDLRRWTGVARHSLLNGERKPNMEQELSLGRIGQISRTVSELAAAVAW